MKKTIILPKYIKDKIDKTNYISEESIIESALDYIKAIKERRVFCVIDSVSSSGMSRNLHFHAFNVRKKQGSIRQFYSLFLALGYTAIKNSDAFRVTGCGMDMVFHSNYSNMREFCRWGLISKKQCEKYSQMTPGVF